MKLGLKFRLDSKFSAVTWFTTWLLSQRRSLSVPEQWCTYIWIYICIYIWIFTYSCPYSLDMHLRKLLTALSYDASRMHFLARDEVEMAPVCRNEWMDGELQMEAANAETTGRDHESVDEPWLLVTDTHLPCSQTVCFGFSELQWKPSCLPPNQWPNKSGWNYGKVNPDKNPLLCIAAVEEEMSHACFWMCQRLLWPGNGMPVTEKAEGWLP